MTCRVAYVQRSKDERGLAGACANAGAIKSDPNTEGAPDLCETDRQLSPAFGQPQQPAPGCHGARPQRIGMTMGLEIDRKIIKKDKGTVRDKGAICEEILRQ